MHHMSMQSQHSAGDNLQTVLMSVWGTLFLLNKGVFPAEKINCCYLCATKF